MTNNLYVRWRRNDGEDNGEEHGKIECKVKAIKVVGECADCKSIFTKR